MLSKYSLFIVIATWALCGARPSRVAGAAERVIPATPVSRASITPEPEKAASAAVQGAVRSREGAPPEFSENARPRQRPATAARSRSLPSIFSVLFYVFLICGVFILILWLMKRYFPGHRQMFTHPALEVLGRSHLDPRRYVALLRVGRRVLVVGVSQEGLQPLSEITDGAEITEILEVARPKAEMGLNLFQKLFQRHVLAVESAREKGEVENRAAALREEVASLRTRVGEADFARQVDGLDRIV